MLQWAILPFKRYFDFRGRSRRMEYWSFALLNLVIFGVMITGMVITGVSMLALNDLESGNLSAFAGIFTGGFGIVLVLYWLAIFIPTTAVTVRRFHDRDMSGWWYLGILIVVVASALYDPLSFVGLIAQIALLVLMLLPGTPGPNRFGPDPKDPANVEVFS